MLFFFPCLPLFSDCTPCEADLHALRLTAGFLYNFHTVPVVCSADLKMKWNRKRLILTVGFCFFFPSVFLDATCRGRTGGCSASSWIGITTRCSWRSPAVWSACRWAAAPTTAPARSESPIEQSFFFLPWWGDSQLVDWQISRLAIAIKQWIARSRNTSVSCWKESVSVV